MATTTKPIISIERVAKGDLILYRRYNIRYIKHQLIGCYFVVCIMARSMSAGHFKTPIGQYTGHFSTKVRNTDTYRIQYGYYIHIYVIYIQIGWPLWPEIWPHWPLAS